MKYAMTCTCGHVMETDADTQEEAVGKIKAMMTPEAMKQHFEEKHPGEPMPTTEEFNSTVEQGVHEA